MATNTEHYNLVKPEYADTADVAQLNGNMDIIDGILWQLANAGADEELLKKVQEILDKIGETADTGGSTTLGSVMAKLNATLTKIGEGTTGESIITMLENLLAQPKNIKNIQTGTLNSQGFSTLDATTITKEIQLTGFTNSNKMIAALTGAWRRGDAYNDYASIFLYSLSTSNLTIGAVSETISNGLSTPTIFYQVIEFY